MFVILGRLWIATIYLYFLRAYLGQDSNPCKAATSKVVYKLDNLVNVATDIDQQTEGKSRIHQWRSMALFQEETGPSNGTSDTTNLLGKHTWSKRNQADENEVNDVSTRRRKLTEKIRAYIATLLKERREKINGRIRKSSIIEDLLLSNKNRIAVEEELAQFNYLFKILRC